MKTLVRLRGYKDNSVDCLFLFFFWCCCCWWWCFFVGFFFFFIFFFIYFFFFCCCCFFFFHVYKMLSFTVPFLLYTSTKPLIRNVRKWPLRHTNSECPDSLRLSAVWSETFLSIYVYMYSIPNRHTTLKWRRINVDATWSRRIDVDTTSFW